MMAVEYCARGHHYVDLDYNVEGVYINLEFVCWDHMTDIEQEVSEGSDFDGEFTKKQLATIARMEKEDPRGQEGP